jgi:hypothetical protein
MAERFPTEISIGGTIKKEQIQALIDQINSEDLQHNWGSYCDRIETEEDLLKHKNDEGILWFCTESQVWGEFPDLEAFLVEQNISFNRHHSPRYEYHGELLQFRAGMETPSIATADSDLVLMVDVSVVAGIRDKMRADKSAVGITDSLKELDALCVDFDIPELPPFEIVD